MSLDQLAPETLTTIIANLHDLGDLHALAMTSRYLSAVCLTTSSPVLSRLFSNSYDYPNLVLLAGVRATQLSDWVLGPYGRSESEQNERLARVDKEVISCEGPVAEALSFLPITFQDLVAVWKFDTETVPRAVRCMPAICLDEDIQKCTGAEMRLVVLVQEAYYQLFFHTFFAFCMTSREATEPWSMPSIRRTGAGPPEARSLQKVRQQLIIRFLPSPDVDGLDDVPTGRRALNLFCLQMIRDSRYAPYASTRKNLLTETPVDRWLAHRQAFHPNKLLGFNDRSHYALSHGYFCLLGDLERLKDPDV
ncbi:hypothetical protein MMC32_001769 [Xylographa parallela]|nr:hypothetical protein [Xylographa parallela]